MKKALIALGGVLALVLLLFASGALYVIDEREQAVITRFGKPAGEPVTEAGLHVKLPFIDRKVTFEKRILQWDGDPNRIPTKDKKYIYIDTFARWRIVDPLMFYRSLRNELSAHSRLDDIIDGATRNVVASMNLTEMVRNSTRAFVVSEFGVAVTDEDILRDIKHGREEVQQMILESATSKLGSYGITLEDVQIKRVNYVESVQQSIYDRMVAERKRAAEQFRSEGQGEKAKIQGELTRDLLAIQSEAQRKAQELRGRADGEALSILARAYNRDPSFFAFWQTLQTYDTSIKQDTKLLLSTDNEYIKYLRSLAP